MPRRVLLLLPQAPQDPSSGAARSLRTICRLLANSRLPDGTPEFSVRAVGTTASDRGSWPNGEPAAALAAMGFSATRQPVPGEPRAALLAFDDHGVFTRLVDTGGRPGDLRASGQRTLDALLTDELRTVPPDICLTFGGHSADHARRTRVRTAGAAVVFGLRQWGYIHAPRNFFTATHAIDAVLTPSEFLLHRYRETHQIPAGAGLPSALDPAEIVAPEPREPVFVTFINPSQEKGVFFFVRLAEQLALRRPDIPLLVQESRGTRDTLLAAARAGGIDLARFENILVSRPTASPREIYAHARLLLVPSAWEEPAGRVVSEALLNGVPPLVADRGGLPDEANGGGLVLPLPPDFTLAATRPVEATAVQPWVDAIERLCSDETAYAAACTRARAASRRYLVENVAPLYCDFFRSVRRAVVEPVRETVAT